MLTGHNVAIQGEIVHFTQEQIEFFDNNGYLLGPRVLSDATIAELKQRIQGILDGSVSFPQLYKGETVERSDAKGQLPSVKVVNLSRHDSVFRKVLGNEDVSTLAHDLMEGPVRLWEDQMIYKPAFDRKTTLGWHQDYTYWDHVSPPDLATCWIAIDDATVDNGCMYVVPGSHRWDLDYSREDVDVTDPEWLLKRTDLPAKVEPVACEVPAGHCHFHHCRTFHGSYGNKTDNPRRSYVMHLMPGHIRRHGNDWNDRMASVEGVGVGEIVKGPSYPELPVSA
jgi:ectoine hydroxylase-related dioxygenase (phytanoyl-CoA dioxygenase family)